ncbi:MAG: hypothetical protein Q8933_16695 [Bacteroidota bacterium]|nr:hypothetical protein [Bacteroidota bacterium]
MKNKPINIVLFLFILLGYSGCDISENPIDNSRILLSLEDVSVTEAYLHIQVNYFYQNEKIILYRDGKEIASMASESSDLMLTDTALTEQTSYHYKAVILNGNSTVAASKEIQVRTLMPTSHNFTWKKYLIGDYSYSELSDVAIIDGDDIWAVGIIRLMDSTGNPDTKIYNALHFDGERCESKRLLVKDFGNISWYLPLSTVWGNTDNAIWFSTLADLIKWDGNNFSSKAFFGRSLPFYGQVNKLWGTVDGNIICVGNKGSIYKCKETDWQQIQAGTTADILDVWGVEKGNGEYEIYCPLINLNNFMENKIIMIDSRNNIKQIKSNTENLTSSLWTNKGFPIYISGDGIYENKKGKWSSVNYGTNSVIERIRGNAPNDIIAVGDYGAVSHYNGLDWKTYPELQMDRIYRAVAIKGDIVAIAGIERNRAVLVIGKRNNSSKKLMRKVN